MNSLRKRGIIIFSILSLVIVACGGAAEEEVVEETVEEAVVESLDSPAVTTATAVKTGTGVTAEPCPAEIGGVPTGCLLYTSPSPRDLSTSRMPSSA